MSILCGSGVALIMILQRVHLLLCKMCKYFSIFGLFKTHVGLSVYITATFGKVCLNLGATICLAGKPLAWPGYLLSKSKSEDYLYLYLSESGCK